MLSFSSSSVNFCTATPSVQPLIQHSHNSKMEQFKEIIARAIVPFYSQEQTVQWSRLFRRLTSDTSIHVSMLLINKNMLTHSAIDIRQCSDAIDIRN